MILSVCMSPCVDVSVEVDSLKVGKTNVVKRKAITLGGKGLNVAIGVSRLGEESYLTGLMYEDSGRAFENLLDNENVQHSFVWNEGRVRENYKFIDRRSMLTEINDVGGEIEGGREYEILSAIQVLSARSDVAVFSGGIPRGMDDSFYGEMVKACDPKCLKIVDTHGLRMFSALQYGVDLVKPNMEELENTIGRKLTSKEDMLEACYELVERGAKRVLLSLGKQGAVITDGKRNFYCKSLNVAVNSTVGAGDGMVAAVAVKLMQGASLPELLRAGVAGGTATVTNVGDISLSKEKYQEVYPTLRVHEI